MKLLSLFLTLLLCMPQFGAAYTNDHSIETFYKDDTYTHFVNSLNGSSFNGCDPANSKLIIYATFALRKHPDFASSVVNDFNSFDGCQKQVLCASLQAANFYNEVNTINERFNNVCASKEVVQLDNINNIQFLQNIESFEDEAKQAASMDHCWAAFFATGDESYIGKMVEYTKLHEGQSDHARIIADFIAESNSLAQLDATLNDILVRHDHHCLSCFR